MGFREMRRIKQKLSEEECREILKRNTAGVLAVLGDEGYPYGVPLSYLWEDGYLYFHCAKTGHKLDAIAGCEKASFCVIDQDMVVPKEYTSYFRSVIVFGRARVMKEEKEIRSVIEKLAQKYAPLDSEENRRFFIEKEYGALCMIKMKAEHISGKEARELAGRRAVDK